MVKYLIWLNTKKGYFCVRYCRYTSLYDIGDVDGYDHILVNVLHLDEETKKFYSMSFLDFSILQDKRYNEFLARNRSQLHKRNIKKAISNKLIQLAEKISK